MDCPLRENGHSHAARCLFPLLAAPLVPSFVNQAEYWDARFANRPQLTIDSMLWAHNVFTLFNRLRQATHFSIPLVPIARLFGRQALESATTDEGNGPGVQGDTDYLLAE